MLSEYDKQATDFLKSTNTEFKAEFLKHDIHFEDDEKRDIYKITLKRGDREFVFNFGQSLACSVKYKLIQNYLYPEIVEKLKAKSLSLIGCNNKEDLKKYRLIL